MTDLLLLAQGIDSLSGGAGWAGAGLLGLVLGWLLLFHLPQKDKQLREILDGHNLVVIELRKECAAERAAMLENFQTTLDTISQRAADAQDRNSAELRSELSTLRTALQSLSAAVTRYSDKESHHGSV